MAEGMPPTGGIPSASPPPCLSDPKENHGYRHRSGPDPEAP